MKRIAQLITLIILLVATLPSEAKSRAKAEYDLYLMIGQSNMAGRGYMTESDTLKSIEGVYILDRDGQIVEARNPLNQYSTIRKGMSMQQIGPSLSFGEKLHRETGRKILLVVNARGGSSIEEWAPDNDKTKFFEEAVRRTKQAIAQGGELKGVIWHQGCSDSSDQKRELYMGRLKVLVESLRGELRDKRLYFVAGELGYWRESSPAFNEMLHSIGDVIPNSDYISAEGAGMRADKSDPHFSREGQIILGERYAEKVLQRIY
ncbi:MAG: sialate O-acetylesterase [Rikenellaceae bacterium]